MGDRSVFYSNEAIFGGLLGSIRMGAIHQGNQAMMRSLKLSAPSHSIGCSSIFFILSFLVNVGHVSKCLPEFWEPFWQITEPREGSWEFQFKTGQLEVQVMTWNLQLESEVEAGDRPVGLIS